MDGFRLRELRQLVGLRQKEIAELLDVEPETINRWEKNGKKLKRPHEYTVSSLVKDNEKVSEIISRRKSRKIKKDQREPLMDGGLRNDN